VENNITGSKHRADVTHCDDERPSSDQITDVTHDDDEVKEINPWREPISHITWGFVLTSFTLNFLLLQYILPTLGVVSLYLGLRRLRKENRWFFAAWILAAIKLIWHLVQLVVHATPMYLHYDSSVVVKTVIVAFQLILLLVLRKALKEAFSQSNKKPVRDPVLLVVLWTGLITACAIMPPEIIMIAFIPLMIFLIIITRSLYKIGDDLNEVDYVGIEKPAKISDTVLLWGYLISCLIFVLASSILANHIKLDVSRQMKTSDSALRTELIELGFPQHILVDISDNDISKLSGAIYIESNSTSMMFNPVKVTTQNSNNITISNKPGDCNLQVTTIYVEFPENVVYVFEYFDWNNSKAYWQDGFTIWGEEEIELLNGVLLFKKDGVDYTAPIPRLRCDNITSYSFFGANETKKIAGAVSYPFSTERQRGYILYRLQLPQDQWICSSCMNFVHYTQPFQYPFMETEKRILNGMYFIRNNMQQHYTTFELQSYRDAHY
jgi:hypothetical protein